MTMVDQFTDAEAFPVDDPNAVFGIGPSRTLAWDQVVPALEAQALRTPAAIAVRHGEESVDYTSLHRRANQLARCLRDEGVDRGDVVAIILPRSADAIVAILGVLKVGAAYLPIDLAYPSARVSYIVKDSGARIAIVGGAGASCLPEEFRRLDLDAERYRIDAFSATPLDLERGADDPIYVIYTSGSTGEPKGAVITHRSFSNLLQWYIRELGLGQDDATLLVSALGFDLTQKNIFAPLLLGGTLNLPLLGDFDPEQLVAAIETHGVTFVNCTPSSFMPLVEGSVAERPEQLGSLRWVVLGGEPILVTRLLPWLKDTRCRARVLNSYGPTECTDICAVWAFDAASAISPVPLGRPIDNVRLAVLDADQRPTAIGNVGELWIGGAGVGLGYLGRPSLNAEKFVTLDVGGTPSSMYRSGDRVRWGVDGLLEFLGRVDDQVKVRGHRIELGEIDAALASHEAVRDAVACVRDDQILGQTLVAYIVVRPGFDLNDDLFRRYIAEKLPSVMVPTVFVRIAAMPMSPNGKIDRGALLNRASATPSPNPMPQMSSASHTSALVWEIWTDVLGRGPDSTDQNFFDLGGTSLGAAKVQAALRRRLGRDVSIVTLFAYPTIASLVRHLDLTEQASPGAMVSVRVARQAEVLKRIRNRVGVH